MKKTFIVIFYLFSHICISAQWVNITPDIPTVSLRDIVRLNSLQVLVVGDNGFVSTMTKSGYTFVEDTVFAIQTDKDLRTCDRMGTQYFRIGGEEIVILSSDAGTSWNIVELEPGIVINRIAFEGINEGYFCGQNGVWGKTLDGGLSWETSIISNVNLNDFVLSIANEIVAIGDSGTMLKSTDNGENWNLIDIGINTDITSISINGAGEGFITLKSVYHTTDFGTSWNKMESLPIADSTYVSIASYFSNYVAFENTGKYYNFSASDSLLEALEVKKVEAITNVKYLDNSITDVWATGSDEYLAGYKNGLPFQQMEIGTESRYFHKVFTFNPDSTIIVGKRLYYSTDAGLTWNWHSLPRKNELSQKINICFTDFNHGMYAKGAYFARTSDGGVTWSGGYQTNNYSVLTRSQSGTIYRLSHRIVEFTTDNGDTWNVINVESIPEQYSFSNLYAKYDNSVYLISNSDAAVFHSTNLGATWEIYETENFYDLNEMSFADSLNGIMTAIEYLPGGPYQTRGRIFFTTDAGQTWNIASYPNDSRLNGLILSEDGRGLASASDGLLYSTSDFGASWNFSAEQPQISFDGIIADNLGNITGYTSGTPSIMKNTGYHFIITHQVAGKNYLPEKFIISQNYPNPFNPVTKIQFYLPSNANITFQLFNINGEVITKEEKYFLAGSYESFIDGSVLASGVYFYKVSFEGADGKKNSRTIKMVLLK